MNHLVYPFQHKRGRIGVFTFGVSDEKDMNRQIKEVPPFRKERNNVRKIG